MTPHAVRTALAVASICASVTPAFAADLPTPIAQAVAMGKARQEPNQHWAYTCELTTYARLDRQMTIDGETIVARYDPRRPEGEEWTPLSPASEEEFTEGQVAMWEGLPDNCRSIDPAQRVGEEPEMRCRRRAVTRAGRTVRPASTYSLPRREVRAPAATDEGEPVEVIVVTASCGGERQEPPTDWDVFSAIIGGDVALAEETETYQRYEFGLRTPGAVTNVLMAPITRHIRGEITVTRDEPPELASLHVYARPFRVPGVARVRQMDFMAEFAEVAPGGPITVVRFDTQVAGSAMRRGGEGHVRTVFSDFERVDVPRSR